MMSRLLTVTLAFCLALAVTSASEPAAKIDIEDATQPLIDGIRDMVHDAKRGNYMAKVRKDVEQLQNATEDLLTQIPDKGPECDKSLVIKMAAARTGSHEVLTALLATDLPTVLDGRLTLSLAFLEEVAHLLEDEVALDGDVAPHLAAIIFGTDITLDIINTADEFIKPALALEEEAKEGKGKPGEKTRARRFINGGGFSYNRKNGLSWTSRNNKWNANFNPRTFRLGGSYTTRKGSKWGASVNLRKGELGGSYTTRKGNKFNASYNPFTGRIGAGYTSKNGRVRIGGHFNHRTGKAGINIGG